MSSQTLARPKKPATRSKAKKKIRKPSGLRAWWPLLAGVVITFAAVKTAEVLPLTGAGGLLKLQLLYPYALLLKQPQFGLSEQLSEQCSQIMLYAQWILYGLYVSVTMRITSVWRGLLHVTTFHLLGFGVLWLLARS